MYDVIITINSKTRTIGLILCHKKMHHDIFKLLNSDNRNVLNRQIHKIVEHIEKKIIWIYFS